MILESVVVFEKKSHCEEILAVLFSLGLKAGKDSVPCVLQCRFSLPPLEWVVLEARWRPALRLGWNAKRASAWRISELLSGAAGQSGWAPASGFTRAVCFSPCSTGYGRSPLASSGGSTPQQPDGDHAESPGARAAAAASAASGVAARSSGTGQGLHGAVLERSLQLEGEVRAWQWHPGDTWQLGGRRFAIPGVLPRNAGFVRAYPRARRALFLI